MRRLIIAALLVLISTAAAAQSFVRVVVTDPRRTGGLRAQTFLLAQAFGMEVDLEFSYYELGQNPTAADREGLLGCPNTEMPPCVPLHYVAWDTDLQAALASLTDGVKCMQAVQHIRDNKLGLTGVDKTVADSSPTEGSGVCRGMILKYEDQTHLEIEIREPAP